MSDLENMSLEERHDDFVDLNACRQVAKSIIGPKLAESKQPFGFRGDGFQWDRSNGRMHFNSEIERRDLVVGVLEKLKIAASSPAEHFKKLDDIFSDLLEAHVVLEDDKTVNIVAEEAFSILIRLPRRPLQIPASGNGIPKDYFSFDGENGSSNPQNYDLIVMTRLPTNILRYAISYCVYGTSMTYSFISSLNFMGELLDVCTSHSASSSESDQWQWLIVRSFLFHAWQRALMLKSYFTLGLHLAVGYQHATDVTNFRTVSLTPDMDMKRYSKLYASKAQPDYMCSWAFELLRTEPVSIGADFRRFHERYAAVHGGKKARCNPGSDKPCDGTSPMYCAKIDNSHVPDQSAHDASCSGTCPKLTWDENSYLSITGPRAVSIAETKSYLAYCPVTSRTLAISHVWLHGQGGRPEEGFNSCLHSRYCRIATALSCDSYFMDTPCIPSELKLRKAAIKSLNDVFERSHSIVVVDTDLLDIDISGDKLTVPIMESILATILVSDWNVRAWTFLEAMKGRSKIRLLCAHEQTVSFPGILKTVFDYGRIDLAIICQLAPHLLPWHKTKLSKSAIEGKLGYIQFEILGTLLSYRPATKQKDAIVIWSMLFGDEVFPEPEAFWRSRVGAGLYTGYLMCSAPRMQVPGLYFAPSTPFAAVDGDGKRSETGFYRAFDGAGSERGTIDENGLWATWLVHEFAVKGSLNKLAYKTLGWSLPTTEQNALLQEIKTEFFIDKLGAKLIYGALLRPVSTTVDRNKPGVDAAAPYRGEIEGTLLAICGSDKKKTKNYSGRIGGRHEEKPKWYTRAKSAVTENKLGESFVWIWRGVFEWPRDVPMLPFEQMEYWLLG